MTTSEMPEKVRAETITGSEALAIGALEAGVQYVSGYPGSPATGTVEALIQLADPELRIEWCINEKSAFDAAFGASLTGVRTLVCVKSVGLNVALDSRERKILTDVLHNFKGAAAITGIGIYLTYGLVLASMNYVTNVSYVAAFRQLSIPLGALFGMVLLNEPRYVPKLIGVVTIFIGLIIVGTA